MTEADQGKPRFEPPPWEQEAFEAFRREQAEREAERELEEALRAVKSGEVPLPRPTASVTAEPGPQEQGEGADGRPRATAWAQSPETGEYVPTVVIAPGQSATEPAAASVDDVGPRLSEERISSLLVQLRVEEPKIAGPNLGLINGVSAVLLAAGLFIALEAVLLFGRTRGSSQQALLLAGTTSIIVMFVGVGFVAGAIALFRKYHKS